ncbi:Ankyrin repeat domain-containing protein 35 [Pleodorina starrii]|uniref:Ankyrin repeat domain-containing protein 35 n=1 Tax=Pleodorina starrii TaxID=330485 RepID=A0A9W6F0L1_9CHLO|nr:Ankyrin repeat domain-containing protein 35 [Pleodorina starrii]GLC51942.1 Ankyrin repeat domain-containing protein 35 [Pleodorina starrii]GLC68519.1 Ankyrin repeat domain-containing protein 35 [Pleodorina starrii]
MGSETANALIEELKRDAEKGELLLWASARGLTADVIELVQTGADPSAKDKHARQAVHYAASNGHVEILEYLFTKGVQLDAEDDVGRGALHYAAAGGHEACVSFLLGKECWRDAPDAADDAPLHLAARSGCMAAVKALVEAGAKLGLRNKRSLTPFAEAVLSGHIAAAEYLGAAAEGGLVGALAASYREVPLLHLAAGMGQAVAVGWLVRQQRCDLSAAAGEPCYSPLHAAALSGDADTVSVLLEQGADPLSQTWDGKLPLELVPTAAPPKAPPPPPPPGSAAAVAAATGAEDPDAAAAAAAAADPLLVRSARRAFRALARAAAEHGGVKLGGKVGTTAATEAAAATEKRKGGKAAGAVKAVGGGGEKEAAASAGAGSAEGEEGEAEEGEGGDAEEYDSPAAICLRQLSSMSYEQQIGKVESYARMDERQVAELPYMDMTAQAAVTALRQAMAMVELFGAIVALRADEDFQSDIRDPRVRDALAEAKRTNDLSRYEDLPGVMSVAAKFKRLHAVTRKAGGLQVVIDDLRCELPGNDPVATAAKMGEMRAAQRAAAEAALQAVLSSVTAAVPEHVHKRIATAAAAAGAASGAVSRRADGGSAGGKSSGAGRGNGGKGGVGDGFEQGEDEQAFKVRMAQKERMDKLRAAATSAWTAGNEADAAVGYVDRLEKKFEEEAARAEGGRRRWRLADYVGEEVAQSLVHTLKALLLTAAAFALMWLFGLMPHQQTASLLAREGALRAAAEAQQAAERISRLEGLVEGAGDAGGDAGGGAAAAPPPPTCGA